MAYTSLSGRKLQAKLGASLNESASAPSSAFAQRQLEKMGWKKGEGLGLKKTGITTHIKVHKREDDVGIGHEKLQQEQAANTWWSSSVSDTLAKLSAGGKKSKKKNKKTSKKEKRKMHYTDEELFEATGGARFGMRAQRRAESKWARSEKGEELMELEKKAEKALEWNGLGEARCVLSDEKHDKKTSSSSISHSDTAKDDSILTMSSKKKRKRSQGPCDEDNDDVGEEKKMEEIEHSAVSSPSGSEKKEKKKLRKKRKKEERKRANKIGTNVTESSLEKKTKKKSK